MKTRSWDELAEEGRRMRYLHVLRRAVVKRVRKMESMGIERESVITDPAIVAMLAKEKLLR